jgi:hypothetical protein
VFFDARLPRILSNGGSFEGLYRGKKTLSLRAGDGTHLEMDLSFVYKFVEEVDPNWLEEYQLYQNLKQDLCS